MNKVIYIGPTILGVAARNTVFDEIPESITNAVNPYLKELCIPLSEYSRAVAQIKNGSGAYYTIYRKALERAQ